MSFVRRKPVARPPDWLVLVTAGVAAAACVFFYWTGRWFPAAVCGLVAHVAVVAWSVRPPAARERAMPDLPPPPPPPNEPRQLASGLWVPAGVSDHTPSPERRLSFFAYETIGTIPPDPPRAEFRCQLCGVPAPDGAIPPGGVVLGLPRLGWHHHPWGCGHPATYTCPACEVSGRPACPVCGSDCEYT